MRRRALTLAAVALLLLVDAALRLCSMRRLLAAIDALHRWRPTAAALRAAAIVFPALERADECLPGLPPSCLRRAVAQRLLAGPSVAIRLGVRRVGGSLEAHAWTGAPDATASGFTRLGSL